MIPQNTVYSPGHVALIQQNILLKKLREVGDAGYLSRVERLKRYRPFLLLQSDGDTSTWVPLFSKQNGGKLRIDPNQKLGTDSKFLHRESFILVTRFLTGPICLFTSSIRPNDYLRRRVSTKELEKIQEVMRGQNPSISHGYVRSNQFIRCNKTVEPLLCPETFAQLRKTIG